MKHTMFSLRNWFSMVFLFIIVVGVIVVGCGDDPTGQGNQSMANGNGSPVAGCHSWQPEAIYIGVDDATNYNKQFFTDGLKKLADFFDQLASTPGFGGAQIFIDRVHDNSFDTRSVVQSFSIPPVHCPPDIVLTPTPTVDDGDPASSAQRQNDAGDAIATAVATWHAQNDKIAQDVRVQTDMMRSLPYLSENPNEKDVYGAVHRAALDLQGFQNTARWLVFLSDLQDREHFTWSEPGALSGAHLLALFYECDFGSDFKVNDTCNQRFWERYFQSLGVKSQDMQFLTPEQSQTFANPFL